MSLGDDVRRACAQIAAQARSVRIDLDALAALEPGPPPEMRPDAHYLEGEPAEVAGYVLALDAINFGSGWFPTLRKRRGPDGRALSGYFTVAWALADRFRREGPWSNDELRNMRTEQLAAVLGQPPDHELMSLYAQALRQLGALPRRAPRARRRRRGRRLGRPPRRAARAGMAMFADHGFFKRAQIVPNDLELAGVARFADIDRLTIFADNLVPHVLRCDGVLVLRRAPGRAHRRRSPAAPRTAGARDPRAAPCTRASWSRSGRGSASATSTTRCGPRPGARLQGAPAHRAAGRSSTERRQPPAGLRPARAGAARGPRRARLLGVLLAPVELGELALEAVDAARQRPDRVGDRVGQVDPVGVGALGPPPVDATTWPGLPTTVEFGGTSMMTTLLAPIFAPWPTVIGPSSLAPEPIVTLS